MGYTASYKTKQKQVSVIPRGLFNELILLWINDILLNLYNIAYLYNYGLERFF